MAPRVASLRFKRQERTGRLLVPNDVLGRQLDAIHAFANGNRLGPYGDDAGLVVLIDSDKVIIIRLQPGDLGFALEISEHFADLRLDQHGLDVEGELNPFAHGAFFGLGPQATPHIQLTNNSGVSCLDALPTKFLTSLCILKSIRAFCDFLRSVSILD